MPCICVLSSSLVLSWERGEGEKAAKTEHSRSLPSFPIIYDTCEAEIACCCRKIWQSRPRLHFSKAPKQNARRKVRSPLEKRFERRFGTRSRSLAWQRSQKSQFRKLLKMEEMKLQCLQLLHKQVQHEMPFCLLHTNQTWLTP